MKQVVITVNGKPYSQTIPDEMTRVHLLRDVVG